MECKASQQKRAVSSCGRQRSYVAEGEQRIQRSCSSQAFSPWERRQQWNRFRQEWRSEATSRGRQRFRWFEQSLRRQSSATDITTNCSTNSTRCGVDSFEETDCGTAYVTRCYSKRRGSRVCRTTSSDSEADRGIESCRERTFASQSRAIKLEEPTWCGREKSTKLWWWYQRQKLR